MRILNVIFRLIILIMILICFKLSYNKLKYESEVKVRADDYKHLGIKCIKLGYYGMFTGNGAKLKIINALNRYKYEYNVLQFSYFDIESSHKEIIVVFKNQINTFFPPSLGPPALFPIGYKPRSMEIEKGLFTLKEQYRFNESVIIMFWKGEPEILIEKYLNRNLSNANILEKEGFIEPSWLFQQIKNTLSSPIILFWKEKKVDELRSIYCLRLMQFLFPIFVEIIYLLSVLIILFIKIGNNSIFSMFKKISANQFMALFYYPISSALFIGFPKVLLGKKMAVVASHPYLSYLIYISILFCIILTIIQIKREKRLVKTEIEIKLGRIGVWIVLLILLTPIALYY